MKTSIAERPTMNPHWTRWIVASLATYFQDVASSLNIPLLIDGMDERESSKLGTHAELRVSGPFIQELSKGYFYIKVGTNVLINQKMGQTTNPYGLMSLLGGFQEAVSKPIHLYRYGPEAEDDQTYFGCLQNRSIKTYHYGQVSVKDRVQQASVDAQFYLELME